jgi:hypothetical protein
MATDSDELGVTACVAGEINDIATMSADGRFTQKIPFRRQEGAAF